MSERLRIGILCDDLVFQRWQADAIRRVLDVPGVEPVVLVMNARTTVPRAKGVKSLLRHPWHIALFLRYRRALRPKAYEPVDLTSLLAPIPRVACVTERDGPVHRFSTQDLDAIAAHRPDVLLRFGFNILKGGILDLPRFGVWSHHHGDEHKYRGQPPLFWELLSGEKVAGAVLQRLTEKLDAGRILRKYHFKLPDHSLQAALDHVLLGSTDQMASVCRAILAGDEAAAEGVPSETTARIRKYPRNVEFLRFKRKLAMNRARTKAGSPRRFKETNFGVLYQPIASLLQDRPSLNVRWLPSPSNGQGRATPFGYVVDGQLNVLYEKYDRLRGLGEICRLRPKRDNVLKRSRTMLTGKGHLSYPFTLEHEGDVLVVVTDDEKDVVRLYRVNKSNDALEHLADLLEAPLCSPTLFRFEGRWWLLGTMAPYEHSGLWVHFADNLGGPFTAHPMNPVKQDVHTALPAGTPFVHEGRLYRPVLDAGTADRVTFMRVVRLDPEGFQEEPARTIGALKGSPWNAGTVTLSGVGDLTLVAGDRTIDLDRHGARKRGSKKDAPRSMKRDRPLEFEDDEDDDD